MRERRGYTLELAREGDARWVRLELVEQRGLLGRSFNVREARAERDARSLERPRDLGGGRLLSWRWIGEREADDLLSGRLRTLEALGYVVLEVQSRTRGAWDWLRELVHRQLVSAVVEEEFEAKRAGPMDLRSAVAEAFRLGHDTLSTVEGVAVVLEMDPERFRDPDAGALSAIDLDRLAIVLPHLCRHDDPAIREIGRRWLLGGKIRFELSREMLERWLMDDEFVAEILADTVAEHGLALLGVDAIDRLAMHSNTQSVRVAARTWQRRLEGRRATAG